MNAAERLELIRSRMKGAAMATGNVPKGLFRTAHPEVAAAPRKKVGLIVRGNGIHRDWGGHFPAGVVARTPEWFKKVERKEAQCSITRKERVSPLTVIAEKWEDQETFKPPVPINNSA